MLKIYISIDNDGVSTYLAQPNNNYALTEGVYGQGNKLLSILSSETVITATLVPHNPKQHVYKAPEKLGLTMNPESVL